MGSKRNPIKFYRYTNQQTLINLFVVKTNELFILYNSKEVNEYVQVLYE